MARAEEPCTTAGGEAAADGRRQRLSPKRWLALTETWASGRAGAPRKMCQLQATTMRSPQSSGQGGHQK